MAPIPPSTDPSKEAYNHGMALDPENRRVQCCYCGKIVSGFNRLQHHLGGIRGNIVECPDVPKEAKEYFRDRLLSLKVGRLVKEVGDVSQPEPPPKRSCTSSTPPKRSCTSSPPAKRTCTSYERPNVVKPKPEGNSLKKTISNHNLRPNSQCGNKGQDPASIMVKRRIGRFFFDNIVDFVAVTSHSFRSMLEMSVKSGEGLGTLSIPSVSELKGWILDDELNDIENYVKLVRLSWPRTGCSILLDNWTDDSGRTLINVIADCPEGPTYLRSADVSPLTKGADALQLLLEDVLEEVGPQNVVQIIAHTSSDTMEALSKQLIDKYRSLFWTVSPTHCISLMLDKIAMISSIKVTLDKAKTITKFIYSRVEALRLLRRHITSHNLVKPSKVKAAAAFLTLENFVEEKDNLELMFTSPDWLSSSWASSVEGEKVANLIGDKFFWDGVVIAVKASIPLVKAMSLIAEDNEPNMGFIYETMDQVKETISDEFGGRKSQYLQFWKIIDEVWNTILHSPLHAAGYFLNPRLHYTEDFFSDTEVAGGLLVAIVRMVENQHDQDLISQQVELYGGCKGDFKVGTENDIQDNLSPAAWWSRFGGHCPELLKLAVRILSQTCKGADSYMLRRDLAEKLLSSGRNPIEQQRLQHLTYIHYNLKLKQFKMGAKFNIEGDEIDPYDDWVLDELYVPEITGSESRGRASAGTDCLSSSLSNGSAQLKSEPKCEN